MIFESYQVTNFYLHIPSLSFQILKHYKSSVVVAEQDGEEDVQARADLEALRTGYKPVPRYEPAVIAGYATLGIPVVICQF